METCKMIWLGDLLSDDEDYDACCLYDYVTLEEYRARKKEQDEHEASCELNSYNLGLSDKDFL